MESDELFIQTLEGREAYKQEEISFELKELDCAYIAVESKMLKREIITLRDLFLVADTGLLADGKKNFYAINCHKDSNFYRNLQIISNNMECCIFYKQKNSTEFRLLGNCNGQTNPMELSLDLFEKVNILNEKSQLDTFSQLHPIAKAGVYSLVHKHCSNFIGDIKSDIPITVVPHLYFH